MSIQSEHTTYKVIISSHVWFGTIKKRFPDLEKLGRGKCEILLQKRLQNKNTIIIPKRELIKLGLLRALTVYYSDRRRRFELDIDTSNFPYYYLIEYNKIEKTHALISLFDYWIANPFFPLTEKIKPNTLSRLLELRETLQ